jgi:hypothetical protein
MTRFWPNARRLAGAVGLYVASVAICLFVLEAGVRIWDGVPLFSTENFVGLQLDQLHKPGAGPGVDYDPRLGWAQTPNFSVEGFTIGDYGIRMPSSQVVPLQQGAVLMVGDSFGVGSGVGDAESWPAQMETALGTQVINAGVGGYGFDQIVLRAEMLLPILKPRVLLVQSRLDYGLSVNRMSIAGGTPKPYFTLSSGELVLHNEPVPRLASTSHELGWERSVFGHSYLVQYIMTRLNVLQWWTFSRRIKWELSENESVEVTCNLIQRLAQIRDRDGVRVILVLQYSGLDAAEQPLSWEPRRSRVLDCAGREGLEPVDTLDALRAVYRAGDLAAYEQLWQMQDHGRVYGHMSAEGNRLVAKLVLEHLATHAVSETQK